jgi:hypothetical protein
VGKEVQTLELRAEQPLHNIFSAMMELVSFLVKKMVDQPPHSAPVQTAQSCQSAPHARPHKQQQLNVLTELSG